MNSVGERRPGLNLRQHRCRTTGPRIQALGLLQHGAIVPPSSRPRREHGLVQLQLEPPITRF